MKWSTVTREKEVRNSDLMWPLMEGISLLDRPMLMAADLNGGRDVGSVLFSDLGVVPSITTQANGTANVRVPYNYKIEAVGFPKPRFFLTEAPIGDDRGFHEW